MLGQVGKKYAATVADKIEELTLNALNEHNPQDNKNSGTPSKSVTRTTDKLHKINGRRRALFIGINYVGQKGELKGCINDVINIKNFFKSHYQIDDIMVLTDDKRAEPDTNHSPTRKNIIDAFKWLIKGAKKGDSLLLHYAGHGGTAKNLDGTEASGFDQTLIPVDFKKTGQIIDDDVHDILCRELPKGVRLTAIFDCCHSESIMDLPFTYNINGNLEIIENDKNQSIATLVAGGTRFLLDGNKKQVKNIFKTEISNLVGAAMGKDTSSNDTAHAKLVEQNQTNADILMFSGCKDNQTSADAKINGMSSGAMSYALIKTLEKNHKRHQQITYTELLREMRTVLEGKYTQVPQLSAGRKLVLDHPFQI
mmetsp:Transcript_18008/g.19796  ORF Transcript_18008/g.19796 Transcript_18008/m.19796 type:complete len:367 (-) Transcript_18008:27-1127(-)